MRLRNVFTCGESAAEAPCLIARRRSPPQSRRCRAHEHECIEQRAKPDCNPRFIWLCEPQYILDRLAPGPYLLLITVAAIGFLLALILIARMHAFLALFITSMALGLAAGMPAVKVLKSMQTGFGDALGFIAVVIGLGAMIGRFLEDSGGGRALADWLLLKSGRDHAHWAVLVAAFLVGLPVFFEVGFVILVPLAWSVARESKRSVLLYALPLAAAMTILHALVPPHPGSVCRGAVVRRRCRAHHPLWHRSRRFR